MSDAMFFPDVLLGSYALGSFVKLLLSALAGGVIGIERELHGRPAGMRTHLLVAVGACLMMLVSEAVYFKYGALGEASAVRLDPGRVAAQIITGIGFLGAGVIIKEGIAVRGLTTAACLWVVAGLGMAFGMGLYGPALLGTLLALASLNLLKRLEPLIKKDRYLSLAIVVDGSQDIYEDLDRIVTTRGMRISNLSMETDLGAGEMRYDLVVTEHHRRMGRELTAEISQLSGVRRVKFK